VVTFGQVKNYSIRTNRKEIGTVRVSKKIEDGKDMYLVSSKVTYELMGQVRRKTFQKTTYNGSCVERTYAKVTVNDSLEEKNIVLKTEQGYTIKEMNGKVDSLSSDCISYTVANLYWQEPVDVLTVFSERFLTHYKVQITDHHVYKVNFGGIKNNFYHYVDGELSKIVVKRLGFGLEIIPKE
jgi:hypothetical protein